MSSSTQIPNFDRLARIYRWMEWVSFGPWLWRCRCTFLHALADRKHALIVGDGDGRFAARLLKENAEIAIDAVDSSTAMLSALLRRSAANSLRVRAFHADARQWQPALPPYDLIVTHFFLDCLTTEEAESLANRLRKVTSPAAIWIVSEFSVPAGIFGRLVAFPIVRGLYCAFGLLTGLRVRALPDHTTALRKAGFVLKKRSTRLCGLLASEQWSVS
jgi:hypothetical protein